MKSKSLDPTSDANNRMKYNKTSDFASFYKSAAEINVKLTENRKSAEDVNKENSLLSTPKAENSKRERSPNKSKRKNKNEPLDFCKFNGPNLGGSLTNNSPVSGAKNSPPNLSGSSQKTKVKSIMKSPSANSDDAMEGTAVPSSSGKRKKRNKSVSFMLEDNEEVAIKKTKSDDSIKINKNNAVKKEPKPGHGKELKNKRYKLKKSQAEKENKLNTVKMESDLADNTNTSSETQNKKSKIRVEKGKSVSNEITNSTNDTDNQTQKINNEKRKKLKRYKKQIKSNENSESNEHDATNVDEKPNEAKDKKIKKKKHHLKNAQAPESKAEGEPQTKSRKKEVKPDIIAEDLENLSIGDNAHTLSNLLDVMTVADKHKHTRKKGKKNKKVQSTSSSETAELEKKDTRDKVKWRKRWNKVKKGDMRDVSLISVIVENLPMNLILNYKTVLAEHFAKCGHINKIGVAEMYPSADTKPMFTTTVTFDSEEAATKALQEDNTLFQGNRIRVKRPLPPTLTTLVVKSYAVLTELNVSACFSGAGKIRSIRTLAKGKNSAVFVEFDEPETVEKAIKLAQDSKIGGKKIRVERFVPRKLTTKQKTADNSENEGDSEASND